MKRYLFPKIKIAKIFLSAVSTALILSACGENNAPPAQKEKKEKSSKKESSVQNRAENDDAESDNTKAKKNLFEGSGEYSNIKVKNWDNADDIPKVNFTEKNVKITPGRKSFNPDEYNKNERYIKCYKPTPSDSFAYAVQDNQNDISWAPEWKYTGIGGPWIPDSEISKDKSIYAVAETVGDSNGPFGTRIVLINTYNWQIADIINLKKEYVKKFLILENKSKLLCWVKKQEQIKQYKNRIISVDISSGRISDKIIAPNGNIISMITDSSEKNLFMTLDSLKKPVVYKINNLRKKPEQINVQAKNKNGKLFKAGKNHIAFTDGNSVFIINIPSLYIHKPFKPGLSEKIKNLCFTENNDNYCILTESNSFLVFDNNISKTEADYPVKAYFSPNNSTLAVQVRKRDSFYFYKIPSDKAVSIAETSKIRPRSKGESLLFSYLPFQDAYMTFAEMGKLYLLYKPSKRWKKKMIFSPLK